MKRLRFFSSFWSANHPIRSQKDRLGHRDSKHFGGFEVNYQFELCRLLDRKVSGFGALENLVHENGRSAK